MDSYKKLIDVLKQAVGGNNNIPLVIGTVTAITGESCTVDFGTETEPLEITEVRLKSTINEAGNYLLLIPKIGSIVTCGSITGDMKDLCVLKVDEAEQLQYIQDGLQIVIDSTDGKVSIKNGTVSLVDLFQSVATIIRQLKVYTPAGPSGTPLPDTITAVQQFETAFKALLK